MKKLNCFVVQGFGPKTDYTDGRVLNLDASYDVIKAAVEEAGLNCIRADEIIHSGTIDVPMYEQLLRADLVIADLSTNNVNAAFELGVRYGLRPRSTIVVAEEKFKSPFDVNHIVIRRYKHMGEDIGIREAHRFKSELISVIKVIMDELRTDSPVYSVLPSLRPPEYVEEAQRCTATASPLVENAISELVGAGPPPTPADAQQLSARQWLECGQRAMKSHDFETAKMAWSELRKLKPGDGYAIRQMARAIYKAKQPTAEAALLAARDLLKELSPDITVSCADGQNNPETLGVWGAIHKHLWEIGRDPTMLDEAIVAYERSFNLRQDHYNDINLAFVLNLRAVESARKGARQEAIADDMWATRVRREVMHYLTPMAGNPELDDERRYWIFATLWEAALGLDDTAAVTQWDEKACGLNVFAWMCQTR
jgi:tetratricopeptide (TPR) repeat protein